MNSTMFKLNWQDVGRGLLVTVLAAVFTWLASALSSPDFTFAGLNWAELIKIAMTAGIAYLGKNFFSTADGKFLGKI